MRLSINLVIATLTALVMSWGIVGLLIALKFLVMGAPNPQFPALAALLFAGGIGFGAYQIVRCYRADRAWAKMGL